MLQLTDFSLRQLQITAILKPIILRRWGLDRRDDKTPNLTKVTPSLGVWSGAISCRQRDHFRVQRSSTCIRLNYAI